MADEKQPVEKPEACPPAEAQTPAVEHPRKLRLPSKRRYEDRALRPDRTRGGYDKK